MQLICVGHSLLELLFSWVRLFLHPIGFCSCSAGTSENCTSPLGWSCRRLLIWNVFSKLNWVQSVYKQGECNWFAWMHLFCSSSAGTSKNASAPAQICFCSAGTKNAAPVIPSDGKQNLFPRDLRSTNSGASELLLLCWNFWRLHFTPRMNLQALAFLR